MRTYKEHLNSHALPGHTALPRRPDIVADGVNSCLHAQNTFDHGAVLPDNKRGRGTETNRSGRFEPYQRVLADDGWQSLEDLPPLKTHVTEEKARTILTQNDSPDLPFDRSINSYRGCEHGCTYCFARPTHTYMGLSAGLDFESRLFAKPDGAALLRKTFERLGYTPKPIMLGTNTDPYQPIEREYALTRALLQVFLDYQHPVGIVTKSSLILRDLDLLAPLAKKGLVKVALSVTTLDRKLARAMEPRASVPAKRVDAIRTLSEAGIPTSVLAAPMIPALNDSELEDILTSAKEAGAREAGYILLRLPLEVRDLFHEWLVRHYPDKARRVFSILRTMRGGKDYDASFATRMTGSGPYADLLHKRFMLAAKRLKLATQNRRKSSLRTDLFTGPGAGKQLSLFEGF